MAEKNEVLRFLALRHDDMKSLHLVEVLVPVQAPSKGKLIDERLAEALTELRSALAGNPDGFEVYALDSPPTSWSIERSERMARR